MRPSEGACLGAARNGSNLNGVSGTWFVWVWFVWSWGLGFGVWGLGFKVYGMGRPPAACVAASKAVRNDAAASVVAVSGLGGDSRPL